MLQESMARGRAEENRKQENAASQKRNWGSSSSSSSGGGIDNSSNTSLGAPLLSSATPVSHSVTPSSKNGTADDSISKCGCMLVGLFFIAPTIMHHIFVVLYFCFGANAKLYMGSMAYGNLCLISMLLIGLYELLHLFAFFAPRTPFSVIGAVIGEYAFGWRQIVGHNYDPSYTRVT
jgi:hypothetical protein